MKSFDQIIFFFFERDVYFENHFFQVCFQKNYFFFFVNSFYFLYKIQFCNDFDFVVFVILILQSLTRLVDSSMILFVDKLSVELKLKIYLK